MSPSPRRRRRVLSPEDRFIELVRMTASRLPERAPLTRVRVDPRARPADLPPTPPAPEARTAGPGHPPA